MVRLLLVFCLLISPVLTVAAVLSIDLANTEVEMGKYLPVKIVYVGDADPGLADVQQWDDMFFVERQDVEIESLITGEMQVIDSLRLYPRHTGTHVLDAIALGGAIGKPVTVSVVPAVREGIDATPRWSALPARAWRGEVVDVAVEIALTHPSNEISAQEMVFPGFVVEQLPSEKNTRDGIETVTLHWRLIAKLKGIYRLDMPPIVQRGRGRWKFYSPRQQLVVVPLPSYIPPTVPAGRVSEQTNLGDREGLPVWQFELLSDGPLPEEVHGVRTTLANIVGGDPGEVTLSKTGSRQRYEVPVPSWSWGLGPGPEIALRYFDTEAGELKTIASHLPAKWRVPDTVLHVLMLLGVVTLCILLLLAYRLSLWILAARSYRLLLAQASDPHQLRQCLLQPGKERTLREWATAKGDDSAARIADELNALCFSQGSDRSFVAIKQAAMRRVHPLESLLAP